LKWSDDTKKTESCSWLSKGSGGPGSEPGRKHSTALSSGGSKIEIKLCLQTHFLTKSIYKYDF